MPGFSSWVGHGPVDARSVGVVAIARHGLLMGAIIVRMKALIHLCDIISCLQSLTITVELLLLLCACHAKEYMLASSCELVFISY